MTSRRAFATFALASIVVGCDSPKRQQARLDSIRADSVRVADSARLAAAIDSTLRADSMAAADSIKAKAPATKTKSTSAAKAPVILGRDSVHMGKAIGMPIVADTARKRPPR